MNDIWIKTKMGKVYGKSAGISSNPLILGLHGMNKANGWKTWEPMLQPLADAGYYVVSVDMPGWGKTPAWKRFRTSPPSSVASAVIAIIDGLEAETAILMGKSWGGGVAFATALAHPKRIEHLILTAPSYRDYSRLVGLTQPVLMTWAEDDPTIPFQYMKIFNAVVANIQLETYPTGGHSAAMNNAEDFIPKIMGFLRPEELEESG